MKVTVTISNKTFWVQTWKLLSSYAKHAKASNSKQARTNPDGTVTADIDPEQLDDLIHAIREHNMLYQNKNALTLAVADYGTQKAYEVA